MLTVFVYEKVIIC